MQYSIAELAQLSGVSAHNIRIWERRYQALQPSRTAGNTRFYDDEQLKRLLNITGLYHAGHKISTACAMSSEETAAFLHQEICQTKARDNGYEFYIAQIIANGLEYNQHRVNQLIARSFSQNGVLETYKFILYPLLVRMGLMWCNEAICPSQEHFLSSIIRQKLFSAIDNCQLSEESSDSWLLFLPEDEDHDIGLMLAHYVLKSLGKKVFFLGAKVPLLALNNAVASIKPVNLLFFMTRVRPVSDARDYLVQLTERFPAQQIYLSGNQRVLASLDLPSGVTWLQDIHDLENILK